MRSIRRCEPRDYYAMGPAGDDGGYLRWLVTRSQDGIRAIDGYEKLLPHFREAAELYAEMQTYKHYPAGEREAELIAWYERRGRGLDLEWQEFACAAGSQFQVYAPLYELLAGQAGGDRRGVRCAFSGGGGAARTVWIRLSIRRRIGSTANCASRKCIRSPERLRERVGYLAGRAKRGFSALPVPAEHRFVLRVMALFYLTHPKVYAQGLNGQAEALLRCF